MSRQSERCFLLTPPGAGAVAVVRVVGPRAVEVVREMLRPTGQGRRGLLDAQHPNRLHHGQLIEDGQILDDVIVAARVGPDGLPVADINSHGGPRVVQRILLALQRRKVPVGDTTVAACQAWPTSHRIDADAWIAIGRASTRRALGFLAHQRRVLPDHLEGLAKRATAAPGEVRGLLQELLDNARWGRCLTEGAAVAIVGPPNAGKSTLANHLFGAPMAIVSSQPGTTRDWVAEPTALCGIPITLVDTPGVGNSAADAVGEEAARRSMARWAEADLCLLVVDGATAWPTDFFEHVGERLPERHLTLVISKSDLPRMWDSHDLPRLWADGMAVSAHNGDGMAALRDRMAKQLAPVERPDRAPALFCRRQRRCVRAILKAGPTLGNVLGQRIRQGLIGRP